MPLSEEEHGLIMLALLTMMQCSQDSLEHDPENALDDLVEIALLERLYRRLDAVTVLYRQQN